MAQISPNTMALKTLSARHSGRNILEKMLRFLGLSEFIVIGCFILAVEQ